MNEKKRTEKQNPPVPPSAFGGSGVPDNKNVSISSGPYAETLPVGGMTVGGVRQKYADRFDIAPNAQAILNGSPVKDDVVLQAGQALMFIQHAGEKGAYADVIVNGDRARFKQSSMELPRLLERTGPGISTGPVILPAGVKSIQSRGQITLWIWEQPPTIQRLSWIAANSPKPYGPGTKYRWVRIALPYLIIAAAFVRDSSGYPVVFGKDECFFRNAPLKSLNDELCYPGLLNCSLWNDGKPMYGYPLSWICTQHLKANKQMESPDIGDRYQGGFEAVRYCLLETSFNLSSEHHEGNSWFSKTKQVDPRISSIEKWEENTKKDPLFVLDVPWIPTGHTVAQFCERMFKQHAGGASSIQSSDDLARIIVQG